MRIIAGFVFAFVLIAAAQAQSARTFVSAATGDDVNLCTRAAPCRSLSRAVSMTTSGGEAIVLDSGGYGPFTVTQGLSVEAPPGVYAGVTATSGNAIVVDAPASLVSLQGLTIVGAGALQGIHYTAGARLTVHRCLIRGATSFGIYLGAGLPLHVRRSTFLGCGTGVYAFTASGTAKVSIEGCTFAGNGTGVAAYAGSKVLLSNSVIVGSTDTGAKANASLGLNSELIIENCRLADNVNGVESSGAVAGEHGTVWISSSTITASSSQGLGQSFTGVVYSRGNNTIEANASNTFGTINPFSGK